MKKKNYKLVKGVIATALAGIMATSFVGCSVKDVVDEEQKEPISLYDESGNTLSVIAFVDENNNTHETEESYGYIRKNGEKYEFYDVLCNNTFSLYEGQLSSYSIYYAPFSKLLLDNDFNKAIGYGTVDKCVIDAMEDRVCVNYRNSYKYYYVTGGGFIENYTRLEKFEPETYFVDNEQNNKEQESTTLVKNR